MPEYGCADRVLTRFSDDSDHCTETGLMTEKDKIIIFF